MFGLTGTVPSVAQRLPLGGRRHVRSSRAGSLQVAASSSGTISVKADGKRAVVSFDLLGSGKFSEEELTVPEGSELIALTIPRPMGIIFEERRLSLLAKESSSPCEAVEVAPGSNAEKAGVKVGDVLRLTTVVLQVSDKVDIISFYGNPPKKSSRRAIFSADGQTFPRVMKAIVSNAEAVELPGGEKTTFNSVLVVLERKKA